MRLALYFFIILFLTLSVNAEIISVTSSRGSTSTSSSRDIHSPVTPVTVNDETAVLERISITTQPGTTPQVFTHPTDSNVDASTNGAVMFRRVNSLRTQTPPPISQFYFLAGAGVVNAPQTEQTPTGAITLQGTESTSNVSVAIVVIISIIALFFILHYPTSPHSKLLLTGIVLFLAAMLSVKLLSDTASPTTLAVYESGAPEPSFDVQQNVVNSFAVTWTGGGPVTFLSGDGNNSCSDGIDNDGDGLVDCDDPGCHSDGDAGNAASCVPADSQERDILEYDHAPVVDNQIDIYDVVNWAQYFGGDTSVLIHCTDSTCSNQIGNANCVGDADPNNDGQVNATDLVFLQTAEINDDNSTTAGICSSPS